MVGFVIMSSSMSSVSALAISRHRCAEGDEIQHFADRRPAGL